MNDFNARCDTYRKAVEGFLQNYLDSHKNHPQKLLYEAMEYSLMSGGKRLRPIFTLEFCRMCGGDWEKAIPFAAAAEMVHNYSLIHDDLPAMDNDDYRRGRLTNHKIYGEGIAILAGDALLTDAFAVAAGAKLPAVDVAAGIRILARCAGSLGMVGGQVLDILSEERECSEQEVLNIQTRKTGALIEAACLLGVVAGGGTPDQIQAASVFAGVLGLAFQIRDDMLDVIGTQEELGKAVGVDTVKNTFVRLYGLEKCEEMVIAKTQQAVDALSAFRDTEFMETLARSLTERNS